MRTSGKPKKTARHGGVSVRKEKARPRDHYEANYGRFASRLYAAIRRETYGEDLGQNSWLKAPELRRFTDWLQLGPDSRLLDVACGSGGPALRIARTTGCRVVGIDSNAQAIANARALGHDLTERATFERLDANQALPFPESSFEALTCIDAVIHFPERQSVFSEWTRILKPGGRLVVTDPLVVTGVLAPEEKKARSPTGFYRFVPPGEDERLLRMVGLEVLKLEDCTEPVVDIARGRRKARESRAARLREIEGDATFEKQQEFLRIAASLAAERRLSRFAFLARKPL